MNVHDCFIFSNELDVLEIRLEELNDVVDRFVIVEASQTFTQRAKPLLFTENRDRFKRFLPKIECVVVDRLEGDDAWEREAFQRNAILSGLGTAAPDDVVLISDVDEIPRAAVVEQFIQEGCDAAAFLLRFYYYKLNCENVRGTPCNPWNVIMRRRLIDTPQAARDSKHSLPKLKNAGWHFSNLGDEVSIRQKIKSFSHTELDTPEFTCLDNIRRRMRTGADLFDRPGFAWQFVPIDESFPRYVRENQARLGNLIAQAEDPVEPPVLAASANGSSPAEKTRPQVLLLYHRDPTTTAAYLETALRRHVAVTTAGEGQDIPLPRSRVVLPELLDTAGQDFDLVLEVQGDSVDVVGQDQVTTPCAWWAIDSHLAMSYGYHFFRARAFDHVFVAQKHHVVRYQDWAWTPSSWLPLAADPDVFAPIEQAHRSFEIGFVGNVLPELHTARRLMLSRLYAAFERVLVARGEWRAEVSRALSRCELTFNRSLHRDVNMRVFEAVACGRPLLTDRLDGECGLEELFTDGEHLLLYDDASLEETARRWLRAPEDAERVATAGRAHLLGKHTYDHRVAQILSAFDLEIGRPPQAGRLQESAHV